MPAKTTQQLDDLSNPYGYSEMDWAAQLDPAYAAARAAVRRLSVGEDGALSVKVKEFVVLGILASRGLQYGVEAYMRRVLAYGATKDELFEAIKAAAVPGGGVAYSAGCGCSKRWNRTGPLHPRGASGVPPPHRPARRHPHRVAGAKRPHGEEVAHTAGWYRIGMRRMRWCSRRVVSPGG
jgi:alkylhydroperoxidase/carboxymuconolactone decarboxylase family protein YurZ